MLKCWLGHVWRLERRATPGDMNQAVVFTYRQCVKCKAIEMLNAGPLGDRNWSPFRGNQQLGKAEQDWFAAATSANYLRLTAPAAGPLLDMLHSATLTSDKQADALKQLAQWHPTVYQVWKDCQDYPLGLPQQPPSSAKQSLILAKSWTYTKE